MDNTIFIAIIGAGTALLSIVATAFLGFLTWSRNIRFQILKDERDRLESKFEVALELLKDGLSDGEVSGRLAAMCHHEFPENVRNEFKRLSKISWTPITVLYINQSVSVLFWMGVPVRLC
jgi:Flp pilus assembly protein TadB